MVALNLPERVSVPLRSLTRSPIVLAILLHAVVLLVPLSLWQRSKGLIPEKDQVELTELAPLNESPSVPPLSDQPFDAQPLAPTGGTAPSPSAGGGFQASTEESVATPQGGGFQASDDLPSEQAPSFSSSSVEDAGYGFVAPPVDESSVTATPTPMPNAVSGASAPANSTSESSSASVASSRTTTDASPSAEQGLRQPATESAATAPTAGGTAPSRGASSAVGNPNPGNPNSESRFTRTNVAIAFITDFPAYPDAPRVTFSRQGLYDHELSFRVAAPMAQVRAWYGQQLAAKGYAVAPIRVSADAVILKLSRNNVTQYLYLVASVQPQATHLPNASATSGAHASGSVSSTDVVSSTDIILSENLLSVDLRNLQVENPSLSSFFRNLPLPNAGQVLDAGGRASAQDSGNDLDAKDAPVWRSLTREQLPEPSAFYQDTPSLALAPVNSTGARQADCTAASAQCAAIAPPFLEGVRRGVVRVGLVDPHAVMDELEPALRSYQVKPLQDYGGGLLYEIRQDNVAGYLSLVPTKDGTSTAVILWNRLPTMP